jgi:hypothetical protein
MLSRGIFMEKYGIERAAEIRQKQSAAKKDFKGNSTTWKPGRESWNKGKPAMWITDGISTRRIYNQDIPAGWKRGRSSTTQGAI